MKPTKKKTNNPQTTLISVWLPKELASELQREARRRDLTKSQLIRKALRDEVATKQPA